MKGKITFDELFAQAQERTKADRWVISKIADVKSIALKFGEMSCNRYTSPDFPRYLVSSEEDLKKYAVDSKIGIYVSVDDKSYPIDETCLDKFAGLAQAGAFVTLLAKKQGQNPVSVQERAEVLNLACRCFSGSGETGSKKVKFLYRDGHMATAVSEDYHVFPFDKFLELAADECRKLDEEGQTRLLDGELSEDIDVAIFKIKSTDLEYRLSELLENSDINILIKIASGDTGGCSISVFPMVIAGGTLSLFGTPIKIKHDTDRANADGVRKVFSSIYSSIRETLELVEELKKRTVRHPDGMFLRLAKAAGLPKREALSIAGAIKEKPEMYKSQYTVWWALNQLLNVWIRDNNPTQLALASKQEAIFRLVTTHRGKFDSEDAPFEWEACKLD